MRRAILLAALAAVAGCDVSGPQPRLSLERMIDQPRYDAYEESDVFADRMAMREPPAGTVPRGAILGPPLLVRGHDGQTFSARVPLPIDRAGLEHGRDRYLIYCAPCHGERGDGDSPVAARMTLRAPPSLVDPPVRDLPPGRIFQAASEGYGLMPSYAGVLRLEERWQVVAFVESLQIARAARLAELPEDVRRRARAALQGTP